MENQKDDPKSKIITQLVSVIVLLFCIVGILFCLLFVKNNPRQEEADFKKNPAWKDYDEKGNLKSGTGNSGDTIQKTGMWAAPDFSSIVSEKNADQISYGKDLIINTSKYLGPNGTVAHISNGMNCQNCHLEAGTKIFGNNYSAVASTYPKFRERSGSIENIYKRVNDCFERSLNGKALDSNSKEMQAIQAYIRWLGKNVPQKEKPKGSGIFELAYLDRPADPEKGKKVFTEKCVSCHGEKGEGKINPDKISYQYPPLWGENSYNNGAGLLRLTRFAGYVKANMPQGATYQNPQLTDEEAWDVAAFVNSQERPKKDLSKDWPKTSGKPIDHPFGPYADKFPEQQHKFGPFKEIAEWKKKNK